MRPTLLYISLAIVMITTSIIVQFVLGDKRECGSMSWTDEGHTDHTPANKLNHAIYSQDICTVSKEIDHMQIKGTIKDWSQFTTSKVYDTSNFDQKQCLKKAFDLGNSLADYELSYCGYDN